MAKARLDRFRAQFNRLSPWYSEGTTTPAAALGNGRLRRFGKLVSRFTRGRTSERANRDPPRHPATSGGRALFGAQGIVNPLDDALLVDHGARNDGLRVEVPSASGEAQDEADGAAIDAVAVSLGRGGVASVEAGRRLLHAEHADGGGQHVVQRRLDQRHQQAARRDRALQQRVRAPREALGLAARQRLDFLGNVVDSDTGSPLLDRFDLVAFDPRGVGYSTALDLSTLGNGSMFLGSTGAGSYTAATLGAGSNSTYRLGGGTGTLTIPNGVLTGSNSVTVGATATWLSCMVAIAAAAVARAPARALRTDRRTLESRVFYVVSCGA